MTCPAAQGTDGYICSGCVNPVKARKKQSSDCHNFLCLLFDRLVNLLDKFIGDFREFILKLGYDVLGHILSLFELLESFVSVAADIAQSHLGLLSHLLDVLGELFAALTSKFRENQSDRCPIGGRIDADIGCSDRAADLFDIFFSQGEIWMILASGTETFASCWMGVGDP